MAEENPLMPKNSALPIVPYQHMVVQSNEFVAQSTNDLMLNQLRILYFLISCIQRDDEVLYPIEVDYTSLQKIISVDNKGEHGRRQYLEELLLEFQNRSLFVIQDTKFTVFPWFAYFTPDRDTDNGKVVFQFNLFLKDHLLRQRRNFTRYELGYVLSFASSNTVRLYNLLSSYAYQGELTISFDQLRRNLNLLNESRNVDKFGTFKAFSARILSPAVDEICTKSDIDVTYSIVKNAEDARKIWGLTFTITKKSARDLVPARQFALRESSLVEDPSVPGGLVRRITLA